MMKLILVISSALILAGCQQPTVSDVPQSSPAEIKSCLQSKGKLGLNAREQATYEESCNVNPHISAENKARNARCSVQADDKGLHGQDRFEFRSHCKANS